MEVCLTLEEDVVAELDEEAELQGFEDREAYLRYVVANRPMSGLAPAQAPAVASRVAELEERLKFVERHLDLDRPSDPGADLGGAGITEPMADSGSDPTLEPASGGDLSEDLDPDLDEDEDAAADDDIAEAVGEVSLEEDGGEDVSLDDDGVSIGDDEDENGAD